MSSRTKWAIVGFVTMFAYGFAIFSLGPFAGPYTNPPDKKILTPASVFILSFGTAIAGSFFSLLIFRFYRARRIFAIYASLVLIALVLILSLINGPARSDANIASSFLTYYLPGSLASIPLQLILPPFSILSSLVIDFSIVTISWGIWGLLGLFVGYLLDRLRFAIGR